MKRRSLIFAFRSLSDVPIAACPSPLNLKFHYVSSGIKYIATLAEKPSVARNIARGLGAATKRDECLHGAGYVVTWRLANWWHCLSRTKSTPSVANSGVILSQ